MTNCEQEEYRALRATIRERGTARVGAFVAGGLIWAALALACTLLASPPVVSLIPLAALIVTFEAVLALHVAVERVGRYLAVFHDDGWEQAAGAFGRPARAMRIDALFAAPLTVAAVLNLLPLMVTQPTPPEAIVVLGAHALFLLRVWSARSAAGGQRAVDTERFEQIKRERAARPTRDS